MRLIDADKLLRDIEHYNLSDGKFQHWVEIQPTVKTEPRWIPCSERLPKERVKVLACLKDWQTGESKTVVSYRIDYNCWHGYGRYNKECVAWMPLPEPYREVDE